MGNRPTCSSNGDLRFGGAVSAVSAGYAVFDLVSAKVRGKRPSTEKPPRLAMDAIAVVVAGLVAAGACSWSSTALLFGVPVL